MFYILIFFVILRPSELNSAPLRRGETRTSRRGRSRALASECVVYEGRW